MGVVVDEESAHVFTSQKGACQVVQDAAVPPAEAKSTGKQVLLGSSSKACLA